MADDDTLHPAVALERGCSDQRGFVTQSPMTLLDIWHRNRMPGTAREKNTATHTGPSIRGIHYRLN